MATTSTTLNLQFTKDITGLTSGDLGFNATSTGASLGSMSKTGTGQYEIPLNGVTGSGTVSVNVTKTGYDITGASKNTTVFYKTPTFLGCVSTSETSGTALLYLAFNADIGGLVVGDITVTQASGSISKGTLAKLSGTGLYTLELSGITGTVLTSVNVVRSPITSTTFNNISIIDNSL